MLQCSSVIRLIGNLFWASIGEFCRYTELESDMTPTPKKKSTILS